MSRLAAILILICLSITDLISAAPVTESTKETTTIPSGTGSSDSKSADVSSNWSLTQNWLISSINQLKGEVNQLGRSYNEHVQEQESESSHSQQSLAHDLAVLRADHTIMSNQQQMLIKLLKERLTSDGKAAAVPPTTTLIQVQEKIASPVELLREERITTETEGREEGKEEPQEQAGSSDEEDEDSSQNHGKRHHHRKHHHHKKFDQLQEREEQFEQQSSRQVESIKSELSALHEITISMFHEMQDLEKKIEDKTEQQNSE
jgi:hypothetical protein